MTTASIPSTVPFITSLRAFHGDPAIKATYLARVHAHAEADEIAQGFYWEKGRGCAVGCTIHGSDHAAYETELGIPRIIARLEDRLFETLRNGVAKAWPERFLDAIPVGADLSLVWPKFAVWMLVDETSGVIRHARTDTTRTSIRAVAELYQRLIDGEPIERSQFDSAQYTARAVYWAAADAAAAAADAAAAAADAAAAAADAAAADAAAAAAAADAAAAAAAAAAAEYWSGPRWREARSLWAIQASDKLVEILASAPVPVLAGGVE